MVADVNVINHTAQAESSHFRSQPGGRIHMRMTESETFRQNLLRIRQERGLSAAELSRMAGLNARAVKDIEEGRAQSPKLATVFAIAAALKIDPGEMIGLGKRPSINQALADFLAQYPADEQARLLAALTALAPGSDE